MRKVICSSCGTPMVIAEDAPLTKPSPCSKCGGSSYTVSLQFHETIEVHEHLKGKVKDYSYPSNKKQRAEFITGEEIRKSDGEWVKKERYWNKDKNVYSETVTDLKNGAIIHSCEESLTDHVGHGSAKCKNKK